MAGKRRLVFLDGILMSVSSSCVDVKKYGDMGIHAGTVFWVQMCTGSPRILLSSPMHRNPFKECL